MYTNMLKHSTDLNGILQIDGLLVDGVWLWSAILKFNVDWWLVHSSVLEINVDAAIYYSGDGVLPFSHCGELYLWWFIWFIADLDARFLYLSHVSMGYTVQEVSLVLNLAFNSSTQLIKLWVDTQACLIYYYFVLKSKTWFGWLNVKNTPGTS